MTSLYESHQLQQLNLSAEEQLVTGVISAHDKILLVGSPKAGKSVFVQQLAHCLGGGHSWVGFDCPVAVPVLYVAAEGDLDELQTRAKAIDVLAPPKENMVWYWSMPEEPLDTKQGYAALLSQAEQVRSRLGRYPALTVLDPAKDLMSGSMKEDKDVGAFLRAVNRYQSITDGAVLIVHHTHRPIRGPEGDEIDESSQAYFGSMRWEGWHRRMYFLKVLADDSRLFWAGRCRRASSVPPYSDALKLTLAEPLPLGFVPYREGWTPTMVSVDLLLSLDGLCVNGISTGEAAHRLNKDRSTLSRALNQLQKMGIITETERGREKVWQKVNLGHV